MDPASERMSGGAAWGSSDFREIGTSDDGGTGWENSWFLKKILFPGLKWGRNVFTQTETKD